MAMEARHARTATARATRRNFFMRESPISGAKLRMISVVSFHLLAKGNKRRNTPGVYKNNEDRRSSALLSAGSVTANLQGINLLCCGTR
jgi:predicted N-formylglutamate amidohydrolase